MNRSAVAVCLLVSAGLVWSADSTAQPSAGRALLLPDAKEPSRLRLDVAPSTLLSSLAIGHQQMVEIAKALSAKARLIIMDEPTSSLSQGETENLFRVIRDLKVAEL